MIPDHIHVAMVAAAEASHFGSIDFCFDVESPHVIVAGDDVPDELIHRLALALRDIRGLIPLILPFNGTRGRA